MATNETKRTAERGADEHMWQRDAAGFLSKLKAHPDLWLDNPDLKYLTLRVDIRDGAFLLFDRHGKQIRIDHVLESINGKQ